MAKSDRLQWGLLSTARINRAIIGPIRNSKRSRLLAVASRSLERAAEYAKSWNIPRIYGSYEELLEDPEIDVIYNSLPNSLHAEWSIKAIQKGKHVLCEKPISISEDDIKKIINISEETGKVTTEAFMYRHHPQTLIVKKLIDEGAIGKIQLVRGAFCYTDDKPTDVRLDPLLGGGSLWDVGCYPINYARYILGDEPVEVYGHQVIGETGVDMFFTGQLLFPRDIVMQFESSFTSPFLALMEFSGDNGRMVINSPYKPGLKENILLDNGNQVKTIRVKGEELYSGEVTDMENAIMYGTPPRISLRDSLMNTVTIQALYESANRKKPIRIDHIAEME
jgi:predicted dehydrogenase